MLAMQGDLDTPQATSPGPTNGAEKDARFVAPTVSLPKGGGAIRGMGEKFAAYPVTGTGSMTVPLATSPGRSGFGPQLSLSYDSGSGNGPFGFGWSLSLPSITRKTDKGLPQYRDAVESDIYVLSGAEDLVPVYRQDPDGSFVDRHPGYERDPDGFWVRDQEGRLVIHEGELDGYRVRRYRPRIEGLFARIERWIKIATDEIYWRSISRDNVTTLYGKDNNSRIFDPADPDPANPTSVFSWLICQSFDDKGNAIVYEYTPENDDNVVRSQTNERNRVRTANRYLKRIKYGNRTPNRDAATWRATDPTQLANETWMFEVIFDYDEHHYEMIDLRPEEPEDAKQRYALCSSVPGGAWPVRPDPFSSHRAGFEVRMYRRCRRVLMFHHIPDLSTREKGYDGLVRSTEIDYADLDYTRPVGIGDELAHQGSTRFASFIARITQSGYVRDDTQAVIERNGVQYATYVKKSLPPVEFEYTQPVVQDTVEEVDSASLENLPIGVDGAAYQWTDLHGEGIPGILTEQADAWFYKRNLSPIGTHPVEFAPLERVAAKPNLTLAGGAQFMDLAGDGQPDLVVLDGPMPGLYEHDGDEGWQSFRPFTSRLSRNMRDPNLKFVDLNGDGHADVLISEDDVFVWHPSLAEDGFGPARRVHQALDEEEGPRLVFADGTQSVYLADLSGDGLTDLARVRNGEVCYWPNLGYGRFGRKVSMDHAPHFDHPDQFDHKRIRLADIDGSGTTDIIYLHSDGVRLYFNQSGNGWSEPKIMSVFPRVDDLVSIVPTDLLGNGTACLVWSSPLPGDARRPMRYVNLMGGHKPHLLVKTVNNLGAETRVQYAPSTKFYLQDKRDGRPWITKLPFPVHVVEHVKTHDHISRNHFVTRYAYHHGYFDGAEREFRGFGMVEQWDTEEFVAPTGGSTLPEATNTSAATFVPPIHTKTWYHTGAYLGRDHVSDFFAGVLDQDDTGEYFREPGLTGAEAGALLVPDTVLPDGLTVDEEREACRALKGSMLRQEIYALDDTPKAAFPYTVAEQNFSVRRLQPLDGNQYAVYFTHPREAINYHYERQLVPVLNEEIVDEATAATDPEVQWRCDPRVQHTITLEVDAFGNVLKSVAIGYGRRFDAPDAVPLLADRFRQRLIHITYTKNTFTQPIRDEMDASDDTVPQAIDEPHTYRTPLLADARTYELRNPHQAHGINVMTRLFSFDEIAAHVLQAEDGAHNADYEDVDFARAMQDTPVGSNEGDKYFRRLIEHVRTLYRPDDLGASRNDPLTLLPLGTVAPLALPGESYKLAFTPGLLAQVLERGGQPLLPDATDVLGGQGGDRGGYLPSQQLRTDGRFPNSDTDGRWWIPSGRAFYSTDTAHPPPQELAFARTHFFLPHRFHDPFGQATTVTYDSDEADIANHHSLLVIETRDPLGSTVRALNDYRVLQPKLVTDPNGNRSEAIFDALGMVAGTAVMGKPLPAPVEGDSLGEFEPNLPQALIDEFYEAEDPHVPAVPLLKGATTRIIYDLDRFLATKRDHPNDPDQWLPAYAATLARETHVHDLDGAETKIQISFSYSDGFGREIQKKIQAEPKKTNGVVGPPRWVGSGWTIFNNKGKPVRQYEPFFSKLSPGERHRFEFGEQVGVSPILFYDPVERVVAILHPNHTYEKVVFDPWKQTTYDVNDTVLGDPRTDPDIRGYTAGYFDSLLASPTAPPWQTWHSQRQGGAMGAVEQAAADKAAAHADTPTIANFDTLGRPFLTVAHNKVVSANHSLDGTEDKLETRVELDIEGNQRAVRDAIEQNGDAQGRVVMRYDYDMLGNRIHQASMEAGERWMLNDVSGNPIRAWDSRGHTFRTQYDPLRRPLRTYATGADLDDVTKTLLVQRQIYGEQHPEDELRNLRGTVFMYLDQAGAVTNEGYDFKGNLLSSSRRLAREFKKAVNWNAVDAALPADPTARLDSDALEAALVLLLEEETFTSRTTFDALNRPMTLTTPHTSAMQPSVIRHSYNEANLLEQVDVMLRGATADGAPNWTPFVTNIDYDAKGQRTLIKYGNGVATTYEYDPWTFRLAHLVTRRDAVLFPADCPPPPLREWPGCAVQNLHYTYDPVGNITHIRDDAQQTVFFRNRRVEPSNEYTYDAIYRLIRATGREHLGQAGGQLNSPTPHDAFGRFPQPLGHAGDGHAMGTYVEQYVYDQVGNFLQMQHQGQDPFNAGWSRDYTHNEDSLTEPAVPAGPGTPARPAKKSNRLSSTRVGVGAIENYTYDAHGNMTSMSHLPLMRWDYRDQLQATAQQVRDDGGTPETTYYVYDAGGERVRKVTERQVAAGDTPKRKDERIYLGGFEIYRMYESDGTTVKLERETLHIMDDKQRVALVESRTQGDDGSPEQLIRYQLANHLGSSVLELDEIGEVISYEEYYPYGSTSYQAVRTDVEVTLKRYRYTGKERDEETGLNYHTARYLAPWLGRWTAPDPAGMVDSNNLYAYARNNPLKYLDSTGEDCDPTMQSCIDPTGPTAREEAVQQSRPENERHLQGLSTRFTYDVDGTEVEGWWIEGESEETALIFGGLHGSERAAIEVANRTVGELTAPGAAKPYYTTIIIPDIFGGTQLGDRNLPNDDDPNRSLPQIGTSVDESIPAGGTRPHDARPDPHAIPPALEKIMRIREEFDPERILQLHGIGSRSGAGITSDVRRINYSPETPDLELAARMARRADAAGAHVPANHLNTSRENFIYPTNAARHQKGNTWGMWGSTATSEAPAANVILIETPGNQPSNRMRGRRRRRRVRELDALVTAITDVFVRR